MIVCTCLVCRSKRKLCFKGKPYSISFEFDLQLSILQVQVRRRYLLITPSAPKQNQKFPWWMRQRTRWPQCLLSNSILTPQRCDFLDTVNISCKKCNLVSQESQDSYQQTSDHNINSLLTKLHILCATSSETMKNLSLSSISSHVYNKCIQENFSFKETKQQIQPHMKA